VTKVAFLSKAAHNLYKRHRKVSSFSEWTESSLGRDLWVDGFIAIRLVSEDRFTLALDRLSSISVTSTPVIAIFSFVDEIKAQAKTVLDTYTALLVGAFLLKAAGGCPRIFDGDVVNNTYLALISNVYRRILLSAYNKGSLIGIATNTNASLFLPEAGFITVAPRHAVLGGRALQFFTVNHEACHHVIFSDLYLASNCDWLTEAIVDAEEICCAADLYVYRDLLSAGAPLHCPDDLAILASGYNALQKWSPLEVIADKPDLVERWEADLRQRGLSSLRSYDSSATDQEVIRGDGSQQFISDQSISVHANYARQLALSMKARAFRRFAKCVRQVGLRRRIPELQNNTFGSLVLALPCEEPNLQTRFAALDENIWLAVTSLVAKAAAQVNSDKLDNLFDRCMSERNRSSNIAHYDELIADSESICTSIGLDESLSEQLRSLRRLVADVGRAAF
jgi:hypothetical protein